MDLHTSSFASKDCSFSEGESKKACDVPYGSWRFTTCAAPGTFALAGTKSTDLTGEMIYDRSGGPEGPMFVEILRTGMKTRK